MLATRRPHGGARVRLTQQRERRAMAKEAVETGPAKPDWQRRLAQVVQTMREMSLHTDPQAMVEAYRKRVADLLHFDHSISVSRRDLDPPKFRITRSTMWAHDVNPWKEKDRLPLLEGGLLAELLYDDEPRILDDFTVSPDDPAAEYLAGQRSLAALPLYDQGVALNMVVLTRAQPRGFDPEKLPDDVWRANLFGRAAQSLVLSSQLREAYEALDKELRVVGDIQRKLLPPALPRIDTMDLAVHYETSKSAGGDYYDFFPLPDGRWGILVADVSGHGTPAAVVMAITHSITHSFPGPPERPGVTLGYINRRLSERYTTGMGRFVTAFYGVYDPKTRELVYSNAGHPPPRVKRCADGSVLSLEGASGFPLGLDADAEFGEASHTLVRGDQVVFFTDGITETFNPAHDMFGLEGVDRAIELCRADVNEVIRAILGAVNEFAAGRPADDDRTLLVGKIW
jgi:sigma-B regulation protein RsbU (phosphoserine phosphatase)